LGVDVQIYLVGGAVRDELLGLPVKEKDWVVVGASPDQLLSLGYQQVGKDFPVFLHPKTRDEYALARTERKTGQGYGGFTVYAAPDVTLEDDLKRRDLTINAIAKDEQGQLVDPYGGLTDLKNKKLRHVSDAFSEDPLRVVRLARFAARFHSLGFTVAKSTESLLRDMVRSGELTALTKERVWQEVEKTLALDRADVFFTTLRRYGALRVLFPELDALFGVPGHPNSHPEIDSGIHTLMVLRAACLLSDDKAVRFAACMHDLGKACTDISHWPKHPGHEEKSGELLAQLQQRYPVPKLYAELALLAGRFHGECHSIFQRSAEQIITLLEKLDAFRRPDRLKQFLLVATADHQGRPGFEQSPYPQANYLLSLWQIARGVDVKPIALQYSGSEIARQLHKKRIEAIEVKVGEQHHE